MRSTPFPLADLALSRTLLDRAAHRREGVDLLPELLADSATAVIVVAGGEAVVEVGDEPRLAVHTPAQARDLVGDVPAVFCGQTPEGGDVVALLAPVTAPEQVALPDGRAWASLRDVGEALDGVQVAALTAAVALGFWHAAHPHCSACGAATVASSAGWTRTCPACGRTHFPRTDPAVIMAVTDVDDRLLLGRQAAWAQGRYSTLAGFVEAGESLEAAVRREVAEECGVVVGEVTYQGSQPWPFPCSLMLGFSAVATSTAIRVDGVELERAEWWTREQLVSDLEAGAVSLPPRLSIARRLIEQWFGGPIPTAAQSWR